MHHPVSCLQPFYPMKETVIPFYSGFTMAKDHYPVKLVIDQAIERLVEAGLVMQLMSRWVPPDCKPLRIGLFKRKNFH